MPVIQNLFILIYPWITTLCHLQALEDEMDTASFESRSRSSTGLSSPLSLPMVRIEVTSPQPSGAQGHGDEPVQRLAGDRSLMVLDFPDVIKSAESSPRHSLIPLSEFYETQTRTLNERRNREIINQINVEVAQAINRGQSPYYIYGIMDNDEETWCWHITERWHSDLTAPITWQKMCPECKICQSDRIKQAIIGEKMLTRQKAWTCFNVVDLWVWAANPQK